MGLAPPKRNRLSSPLAPAEVPVQKQGIQMTKPKHRTVGEEIARLERQLAHIEAGGVLRGFEVLATRTQLLASIKEDLAKLQGLDPDREYITPIYPMGSWRRSKDGLGLRKEKL